MKNGRRIVATIGTGLVASWALFSIGNATKADSAASALATAPLTADLAAQLSKNANRSLIVIMKNTVTGDDAAKDQEPVMNELQQVKAARVKAFRMVNAFAATVSDGELLRLQANPAVAAVIPDLVVRHAPSKQAASAPSPTPTTAAGSLTPNVIPSACGANGKALLDPEALQVTHTNSDDPAAKTARSLGLTGAGVKVAWIADGIDPQNVNFLRADGTSAFVDYQDFSGDGPGAITTGDEAFLDANAIAGQGLHVYNVSGFGAQLDPSACNVRIEGMAPGAQLVGLKVFSQNNDTTQSNFLQAIEYAVTTAHVDVINESFGANFFPDVTSQDIEKQFNDAAVRAGVTVTVSSGDAGSTNTVGTPATDPLVISVGGSTTFRVYAQTNYAAARYFATSGWLNDNITSLSSGGFTQTGATLDLVAPGDMGFASCDASATFTGCTDLQNKPSDVEKSGGTSMAAPLTAGTAALVIQAYRLSHGGASPAPALVKQIILSTATDLGLPSVEQGAGLVNAYKAAQLAQTVNNGSVTFAGAAPADEQPLLLSANQLNAVGNAGSAQSWPVTVTNTTGIAQNVTVTGRAFGEVENVQTGVITLSDASSPKFADFSGPLDNYGTFTFTVPPTGADRLNASLAYPANPAKGMNARVRLILIDPKGRFAAHSLPQGVGNFGNVDVRDPAPGTWTGVIFSEVTSASGTVGAVPWQISTQAFAPFAKVSPSRFRLAPGHSRTVTVTATTPTAPGDAYGSVVVTSSAGGTDPFVGAESTAIPVTLRTLVDLTTGGDFGGTLTGGNGRDPGEGQIEYFQFRVEPGHSTLTANVTLTNDIGDILGLYLVNPDGVAVGFGQNSVGTTNSLGVTASALNPQAGTWTLILDLASNVVGDEISQAYSGNIQLDGVFATAAGLPSSASTELAAGTAVTIPVTVTNHGAAPESVFLDARLDTTVTIPLAAQGLPPTGFTGYPVPTPTSAPSPLFLVPTETSGLAADATANLPIEFDFSPQPGGDPDIFAPPGPRTGANYTASGSYTPKGGVVSPGVWQAAPSEIGPYSSSGAASGVAQVTMTATTKAFDPAVVAATGDLWLAATNPALTLAPVTVNPGESVVINVSLTPSGASGTVVSGTLYVDDTVVALPPYGESTGNELAAIPYRYTIK